MTDAPVRIELELSNIRFLFPNFITPVIPKDQQGRPTNQDPRHDGTIMIPKDHPHVSLLRQRFRECLVAEFGEAAVPANFAGYHLPIKDGDQRADDKKRDTENKVPRAKESEFTRGYWLLAVKSGKDYPPALAAVVNGQVMNLGDDMTKKQHGGKFYSGVNGGCMINFKAFRPFGNQKEPGVSVYINEAFSTNTGDKIADGGGRDPAARFGAYVGKSSDVDPTQKSASGF